MNGSIVDISGLANFLGCSKHTLLKQWQELPKVNIGKGTTARSARFNTEEVWIYLKEREQSRVEDGTRRQKDRNLDRGFKSNWISKEVQKGFSNQRGSKGMGKSATRKETKPAAKRHSDEDFRSMLGIP